MRWRTPKPLQGRFRLVLDLETSMKAAILAAALIAFASPAAVAGDDMDAKGRAKLAELMALVRESEKCPQPPDSWAFDVIGLYVSAGDKAPTEDEIDTAMTETEALRAKIGAAKWCAYYLSQMEAAHAIVQMNAQ